MRAHQHAVSTFTHTHTHYPYMCRLDKPGLRLVSSSSHLTTIALPQRNSPSHAHVHTHRLDEPGLRLVGSASHLTKETEEFISLFNSPEFMQVGSSLKLLMVAEGAAHIYPRCAHVCVCVCIASASSMHEVHAQGHNDPQLRTRKSHTHTHAAYV